MTVNGKRLLLVLEATIGGTRRHLRELALGMVSRGWNVHIAYSKQRDPDFCHDVELFVKSGIECTEIKMLRSVAPFADLSAISRLRKLIRRFSPDIVHLHSSKAGLIGRLAVRGSDAKVVYTPHCFSFNMSSPFRLLYRFAEKLLISCTDELIAVCKHEADCARALGYRNGNVHLVYNGIAPDNTIVSSEQHPTIHKNSNSLVFVGRSSCQKGLDILLSAYDLLKQKHHNLILKVMSDATGRLLAKLEKSGAVYFPFGTEDAAERFLDPESIFVLPSRWEAFPYTLLDALCHGMPVVAADVGGVRECVTDGENGILVPPGSPFLLANAIETVLSSSELREKISHNAMRSIYRFSLKSMLDDTETIYNELVKDSHHK